MCTAGFWTDKNGIKHFFKNLNLAPSQMPKKQSVKYSKKRIFLARNDSVVEGMNNHGVVIFGLSLKPYEKVVKKRKTNINIDLLKCKNAKSALKKIVKENKKYDFDFIKLIGDQKNVYLVEVSPFQFSYADLTLSPFFATTNHGQLLIKKGRYEDENNSSHLRLKDAQNLLRNATKYSDIKSILVSHKNGRMQNSICNHSKSFLTVGAYIFSPEKFRAEICLDGQPCKKGFKKYEI